MKCPASRKNNCEVFIYGHGRECWGIPKEGTKAYMSSNHSCLNCPWYVKNYKEGHV
ncbi:MAG: hypothetical protein V1769_06015 [Thermoplasmatota archaeon]